MTNTAQEPIGVIAVVQRDHREIEQMMQQVETSTGAARQDAFEDLVRKLAVHETAEEEVVHPLTKNLGGEKVADAVLNEEVTAKKTLAKLDGIDVTTADFEQKFRALKQDVISHADHEEREEHPWVLQHEDPERLEKLGRAFEVAEKTAPTRPHANAPTSRAGNLALGPILAVADRARDAVRDAMKKS